MRSSKKKLKKKNTMTEKMQPNTGIEQAFLKKRPAFIREAPDYEPINISYSNPIRNSNMSPE
jgi:hypothetical protein